MAYDLKDIIKIEIKLEGNIENVCKNGKVFNQIIKTKYFNDLNVRLCKDVSSKERYIINIIFDNNENAMFKVTKNEFVFSFECKNKIFLVKILEEDELSNFRNRYYTYQTFYDNNYSLDLELLLQASSFSSKEVYEACFLYLQAIYHKNLYNESEIRAYLLDKLTYFGFEFTGTVSKVEEYIIQIAMKDILYHSCTDDIFEELNKLYLNNICDVYRDYDEDILKQALI